MILAMLENMGGWWRHAKHAARDGWQWRASGPCVLGHQAFACSHCGWIRVM